MQAFRYYCLDQHDRIFAGVDITALDLGAAVRVAHEGCRNHPRIPTSRVEVWQGSRCLYKSDQADERRKSGD